MHSTDEIIFPNKKMQFIARQWMEGWKKITELEEKLDPQ